ncbi:MAG: N-6 DNA methylase, partial [Proteobacteria bacterium]|nr:N-6 DNA methylase [Pseudomonadota bacterium]
MDSLASVTNESANAELRGRPDFAVAAGGLLQGYVELKAPGKGARPSKFTSAGDKAQWAKFRNLPNILYTDGNEWGLYQEGSEAPVAFVAFNQDITIFGAKGVTGENAAALAALISRFLAWEPIVPTSPKDLAVGLARLCHYLREDVQHAVLEPNSSLSVVMTEWQARLFPDADVKRFSDAYAQTVTYALLLARSRGLNAPVLGDAVAALESSHGLLGQALNVLTQPAALDEVRPAVDVLFRYVLAVDLSVFAKSPGEPWLYFYEDFLAEYDPALRRDYGVYYTPIEVVKAQTALVSALLRERFDRKLGFADDGVTVLDPGVGTATYLLGIIENGVEDARSHGGPGYVASRATVMASNIHGFEILVGPYAVSHLRVSEELARHGATMPSDGIHVYLTDTLESPNAPPPVVLGLFGKKLSDEHNRALSVKAKTPILVCIGNPPYDRHSADDATQRGGWVRYGDKLHPEPALLLSFIEPVQKAGRGGDLKNLYNSYVYFWRWALWKVFEQSESPGIVAFITASSYLRGPGFL